MKTVKPSCFWCEHLILDGCGSWCEIHRAGDVCEDYKVDGCRVKHSGEADKKVKEHVNNAYKLERVADDGKTLKPLEKSDLLQKRGMAVLVEHTDGSHMMYGMDRVAAVIDTISIYGESQMGIVAIYGRGLTLGDSEYGRTWVAYDYNCSDFPNSSKLHSGDINKMGIAWKKSNENPDIDAKEYYRINSEYPSFLVMIENGVVPTVARFNGKRWIFDDEHTYRVICWMPLPEPPKEAQK